MYTKKMVRRRPLLGFGDFTDETPCTSIPAGDAYRRPGNYCATAAGGYTTFNADGSIYEHPSDPQPSVLSKIGSALAAVLSQRAATSGPVMPVAVAPGMSTTTKVALAGGAVLLVVMLARR